MAVILNLVIEALLGRPEVNLYFHFAGSGDPEDYMKHFLQTLVIAEIAEVYLKTTFPTSCRGHLVLCNREDHQISQINRAAILMLLGAFCSLLDLA